MIDKRMAIFILVALGLIWVFLLWQVSRVM